MDRSGWRLTPTGATLVILLEAMCQSGSNFVLNLENYISQNILFNLFYD
jgi:DNA-binding HxlR family transcriptional regulator